MFESLQSRMVIYAHVGLSECGLSLCKEELVLWWVGDEVPVENLVQRPIVWVSGVMLNTQQSTYLVRLIASVCIHSFLISSSFLSTVAQNLVLGSSEYTAHWKVCQMNGLGNGLIPDLPKKPYELQVLRGQ